MCWNFFQSDVSSAKNSIISFHIKVIMLQDIFGLGWLSEESSQWEGQRIVGIGNKANSCHSHSEMR